jgi:hypothetical protein
MALAKLTHDELLSRLLIEASLASIAGTAKGKFPVEGKQLNDEERAGLGRRPGGSTMFYPVGETGGVFIDLHGAATSIWFQDGDSSNTLAVVEAALKRAYPKAVQVSDKDHPTDQFSRQRSYDVPLGGDRVAVVDLGYPAPGALAKGFLVRVLAYARRKN